MNKMKEAVIQDLRELLGPDRVAAHPGILERRARDTWPLRLTQLAVGLKLQEPVCVVKPRSTEEVSQTLAYLQRRGLAAVPYGGGSGVTGGAEPFPGSVVVDLGEMDQILGLDEENLTVTVQPGLIQAHLENWLNKRGYICGHYPQSIDLAQVGGLVATRSAGQFSTRYGCIEDLLVGLEAVLPGGEIVRIKNVPRRSAGPDLRHIWLGSEGVFGVITEVTLKVFPKPADRWLMAYAVPVMRQGLDIIRKFMREGWRPAVVRLYDAVEADRKYAQYLQGRESILLLLSEGPEGYAQTEGRAVDRIVQAGGGRPLGPGPVEAWLEHRNDVHELEKYTGRGVIVDTIEVAANWTAIADIYDQVVDRLIREVPEIAVVSAHSSHSYPQGTNLYFT
ncbi:MAG: FAD-binding oxidoreductase, partial [Peptococcaceae bacterium]|nr:FAD-binding oxidoreductase [Peptococcaceae bacterium]